MITMQNFLLHCASQSAMNTALYLTRKRFASVLRKIHFTLDEKIQFCGICIVKIQFEVFGLEVGSSAFPTPFRRMVRFVTSRAIGILFFGSLAFIAFLFLLSFEFWIVILEKGPMKRGLVPVVLLLGPLTLWERECRHLPQVCSVPILARDE